MYTSPAELIKTDLNESGLACPKCKHPLTLEGRLQLFRCAPCDISFPIVNSAIAALFEVPDQAIAKAYSQLHQTINSWHRQGDYLSEKLKSSNRKQALLPLLKAQAANQEIFEQYLQWVDPHVKPRALLDLQSKKVTVRYGYNFNYLLRDWTDHQASQLQLANTLKSLHRCLRLVERRGCAAVLGMGAGRIGLELADYFQQLWGIDDSFGQVAQYVDLLQRDISFWIINSRNQLERRNSVKKWVAAIPPKLKKQAGGVNYIWSDALNMPFKADKFDWVISVYFSDVKPLPELLTEVKRVLKKGGYFLHCGPLEYHFNDVEYHYALDEFKENLANQGFELVHESITLPNYAFDRSSLRGIMNEYTDAVLLLRLIEE